MRMLLQVEFPNEPFNSAVREGWIGKTVEKILSDTKAEAVYFTEQNGQRGAFLIVNVNNAAQVPALAEPWFLQLNATCKFRIVMTADELKNAGLAELGKKWS